MGDNREKTKRKGAVMLHRVSGRLIPILAIAAGFVLVAVLAGCVGSDPTDPIDGPAGSGDEPTSGMPNPWHGAYDAAEAAEGAGVGTFDVPDEVSSGGIIYGDPQFLYMEGIAHAAFSYGGDLVTVRKGTDPDAYWLAGDYRTHAITWSVDVGGIVVTCKGDADDEALLLLWNANGYSYSVAVSSPHIEQPAGMSAEEVAALVRSVQ